MAILKIINGEKLNVFNFWLGDNDTFYLRPGHSYPNRGINDFVFNYENANNIRIEEGTVLGTSYIALEDLHTYFIIGETKVLNGSGTFKVKAVNYVTSYNSTASVNIEIGGLRKRFVLDYRKYNVNVVKKLEDKEKVEFILRDASSLRWHAPGSANVEYTSASLNGESVSLNIGGYGQPLSKTIRFNKSNILTRMQVHKLLTNDNTPSDATIYMELVSPMYSGDSEVSAYGETMLVPYGKTEPILIMERFPRNKDSSMKVALGFTNIYDRDVKSFKVVFKDVSTQEVVSSFTTNGVHHSAVTDVKVSHQEHMLFKQDEIPSGYKVVKYGTKAQIGADGNIEWVNYVDRI